MKNPLLAGIVNAIAPGAGYLMIGRRVAFGALMLVSTIALMINGVFISDQTSFFLSTETAGKVFEAIAMAATALAFGYDAYVLARK